MDNCRAGSIDWITLVGRSDGGWLLARRHIIQHIYKHGTSAGVTIPRAQLFALGWQPGQFVVSELLEDKRGVLIRLATARDLDAPHAPRVVTADVVTPQ